MINFKNLLSKANSGLICNASECLSFIIVFLNLLTIFYLVYSSYRKITNITIIFGYVWSCFIMCASIVVLAIHTCIFTIGGTIFTGMAIVAVLSMIFENKNKIKNQPDYEEKKKNVGSYVIYPTTDNNFVFGLHNRWKQLLAMSKYKYRTIEEVKEAINIAKLNGNGCDFEDSTKNWVIDAKHPMFKMYSKKQKYFFELAVNENFVILKSEAIDDCFICSTMAKQAKKCVTTNALYFANSKKDIKNGKKFSYFSEIENKVEKPVKVYEKFEEEDNEINNAKTLAESLKEIADVKTSNNVNKKTLFEYLNAEYGNKVVLNRRENLTKTGLPLADTYYTFADENQGNNKKVKKKVCFAYVYENNGACLILVRLDKTYTTSLKNNKKSIMASKFPKTKQMDWYSVIVNDTFTENEIHEILRNSKNYCER